MFRDRVYRAVNREIGAVAACKVVMLTKATTAAQRKDLHKEIKIHSQLNHRNILTFMEALTVEDDGTTLYVPAVYMLLELAGGGDLFDKIGVLFRSSGFGLC